MSNLILTGYVLVWPILAAIVLLVLCGAFINDVLKAKEDGDGLV